MLRETYSRMLCLAWSLVPLLLCLGCDALDCSLLNHIERSEYCAVSVSPVWVSGFPATASFTCFASYPELRLHCRIRAGSAVWNASEYNKTLSTHVLRQGYSLMLKDSEFRFNASSKMIGGRIICDSLLLNQKVYKSSMLSISEPCVTSVDLGARRYWLVGNVTKFRVTSLNCTNWNVSHTCWLAEANVAGTRQQLFRVQQESFSSTHLLPVSRRMAQRDWLVGCSVNQSGFLYPDVHSVRDLQPKIFYPTNISASEATVNGSRVSLTVISSDAPHPAVFSADSKAEIQQLSATVSGSHLQVTARVSGSDRIPVSSIACQVTHISNGIEFSIRLRHRKSSKIWEYAGNSDKIYPEIPLLINCTAKQRFQGELVFQVYKSATRVKGSPWQHSVTAPGLAVAAAIIIAIFSCFTVAAFKIGKCQGRISRNSGVQQNRRPHTIVEGIQLQSTFHSEAPSEGHTYSYPSGNLAGPNNGTYEEPEESETTTAAAASAAAAASVAAASTAAASAAAATDSQGYEYNNWQRIVAQNL